MSDTSKKCAHPACNCIPADGSKHCSQVCADAKDITELACQCMHSTCHGKELMPA